MGGFRMRETKSRRKREEKNTNSKIKSQQQHQGRGQHREEEKGLRCPVRERDKMVRERKNNGERGGWKEIQVIRTYKYEMLGF